MKGVFWNSRGLADLAKHRFLAELVKEEQINFIALSETGRDSFPDHTLKNLCGGHEFLWHAMAPHGRSGGILLGVDLNTFDIGAIDEGDFYVKFTLRYKSMDFKFVLYTIYGPAQDQNKHAFLSELANTCSRETLPYLIGGDFNIMRKPEEKSRGEFDHKWPSLFNAVIESLSLREIIMTGRQYTWAGPGDDPTYEKLDRILVSTEWETQFPMTSVETRDRSISDHTPLVLSTGSSTHYPRTRPFKFERGWLLREGFYAMVADIWQSENSGSSPLQRWQSKIRRLRQHLRGWAANVAGTYKKEKKAILDLLHKIDKKGEHGCLSDQEINLKQYLKERLVTLLREEELKWYERAKIKTLLEGDSNTRFFHLVANGKHRKQQILSLEDDQGTLVGMSDLKKHITNYYKNLFGTPELSEITLEEDHILDIPQVTPQENDILTANFSESEVREAIFQMEHNKAPGPDGFPAEFYQVFWDVIKDDLLSLFKDFHDETLDLFSLNFGIISLIPKIENANKIQQFRPICVLNVSFKIFTKVGTNRLNKVAKTVVSPTQTAFMPGRNIMEGVVILHETIHELHTKKRNGVIFKIDFEKAYDKVKWSFLQQTLRMKGFSPKWCRWVHNMVTGGSVGIKVNDDVGPYFQTKRGLRQGDPMSPILFNIVADMLALLITRAKTDGQISGVIPHLVDDGLSILQYADDTIIFMDHDLDQAKNLKLLLCAFEQLSGLKINFHKSEIFCYGAAKEVEPFYTSLFGCNSGTYPFRYLGIPMHHRQLLNSDWRKVEERFEKKLSCWKAKYLSYGGRLVLLNSVLSSLPMFMMSFFEIPKGVLKNLDHFRSRFFWQGSSNQHKYRLARWDILCRPKDQGGLGILDLHLQNKCLLAKWLVNLLNTNGTWQSLLRNKYLRTKTLTQVSSKPNDSHFWRGLMHIKDEVLSKGSFIIKNGTNTRFWIDTWTGNLPLKDKYPSLYNIARDRQTTVAKVMSSSPLDISFRRSLVDHNLRMWLNLVASISNVLLVQGTDYFKWTLTKSGLFTVRSMYRDAMDNHPPFQHKKIWKYKIPLKIKIFLWFLRKGVILTKDNLARKNWKGSQKCVSCNLNETTQHLFLDCPLAKMIWRIIFYATNLKQPRSIQHMFGNWLANQHKNIKPLIWVGVSAFFWAIWNCRNDVIFKKTKFISIMQVIFRGAYWLRFWAQLQRDEQAMENLIALSKKLEVIALEFANGGWKNFTRLL
jgi:exonuclease III